MFKYFKLIIFLLISILVIACEGTTKKHELWIDFSADSSAVQIFGMSEKSLAYLRNNIAADSSYQQLVSVVQTINDKDTLGREETWKGNLRMRGDTLVFMPEKPFVKGKSYLVQTVISSEFGGGGDVFTSNVGDHVKMQAKVLKR